jgi:hypothetical protein
MTNATATRARDWSPGRVTIVAVLTVVAVLAVIACIMYLTEPAKSLPSMLGAITAPASRADAHRSTRGYVALAFGVICLAAAGFASKLNTSSPR